MSSSSYSAQQNRCTNDSEAKIQRGGQLSLLAANKHIHALGKTGLLREYLIRSPNNMAVVIHDVDPNDLRFTQLHISPAFQDPYQWLFLKDAIANIKRKDMTASTFPKPEVIMHENTLWCLDNRRLFVFRKAKVEKIDVQIRLQMHPRLSSVLENPADKEKLMKKNYFPYVLKYRPGRGVHTKNPPIGYPAVPLQAGNCSLTGSIHHQDTNLNRGQHYPCRYPEQYLQANFELNPMQVAWLHAYYCGSEARCNLRNTTNYIQLQGSAATISTPVAKAQEDHVVRIDPARNPEVGVCAPPPPIVISPRLVSTPKCAPSQVPSGPICCVYSKKERIASPTTTASMKPNACRDPKPARSRQDLKGKVAVVGEKASSQLPSKIPSSAGLTMSSECPQSETRMDPRLATGVWKPEPRSIPQGMRNHEAPPTQLKVTDTSMDLLYWQPINLETIPCEELQDKTMNLRILPIDDMPIEILRISTTPANHQNQCVVDMPPSSESYPFLRHVAVTDIQRIWRLPHVPCKFVLNFVLNCWGFVCKLVKKLGRRYHLLRHKSAAPTSEQP